MAWTASMVFQGTYMIAVGALIIATPSSFCDLVAAATVGWIEVVADCQPELLASQFGAIVGFFYVYLGVAYLAMRSNLAYARYSAFSRTVLVPLGMGLLVLKGAVRPKVLLFAAADVAVGAWTACTLPSAGNAKPE